MISTRAIDAAVDYTLPNVPPELRGRKYQFVCCKRCGHKSVIAWDDCRGHQQIKCKICKYEAIYNMDELKWRRLYSRYNLQRLNSRA